MKLRRYSEGTVIEVDAERDEMQDFVPLADRKKLVEANSHAHTNIQVWTKILQMLAEGKRIPQGRAAKSSAAASIVVPISELRRFYSSLKLLDKATWKNMSQFYCGNPKSLERLWNNARKTFSEYRNQDGWSQGKREALPTAQQRLSDVSSTNEFTAFMKQNGLGDKRAKYTFVERELNPWSTRLGMFSDKLPATKSGKGGIDLLLQSQTSGFPVVGEVKVKDDKNAFFALI